MHTRLEGIYSRYFTIGAQRKIICVGRNYHAHIAELSNAAPKEPLWFDKPMSSILLPGENLKWLPSYKDIHHEIELGVVIGMTGKNIEEKECMKHISGYFLGIDFTNRALQNTCK